MNDNLVQDIHAEARSKEFRDIFVEIGNMPIREFLAVYAGFQNVVRELQGQAIALRAETAIFFKNGQVAAASRIAEQADLVESEMRANEAGLRIAWIIASPKRIDLNDNEPNSDLAS